MGIIDPATEGPTQREILEWRQQRQDKIHKEVCVKIGDEVIKIGNILEGKILWNRQELKQIITPEGEQFMCPNQSIQEAKDKTILQIDDIFVTNYTVQSTARFDSEWDIEAGTIIRDMKSTGDAPSGSSSKVWTRNSAGGIYLDKKAYPIDISYEVDGKYRKYMQERSVPNYTISPINCIKDNDRIGTQGYIID